MNYSSSTRLILALVLIFVLFGYVIHRLYEIQVTRQDELMEKAQKRYMAYEFNRGKRGDIRDQNGVLFASDKPYFTLIADPCNFPPKNKTCPHLSHKNAKLCARCPRDRRIMIMAINFLSENLGIPKPELEKKLGQRLRIRKNVDGTAQEVSNRYVQLVKQIDYEEGKALQVKLKNFITQMQKNAKTRQESAKCNFASALRFEINYTRSYPRNEMLSNVVGFVNITGDSALGVAGLEKTSTAILSPKHGKRIYERASRGGAIGGEDAVDENIPSISGADIYLTIQEPIQSIIEDELNHLVEKHQPKFAYIIVADPKTGDILAMAQRPTFNPNDRTSFRGENTRNLMGENIYEPGSTFKPITVSRAIDDQLVTTKSQFFCENGYWYYAGKPLRDTGKYGAISVHKIIQVSSNIGTAKVAMALGDQRVYDNLVLFGFGKKTNLPIRPESRGILPDVKRWSKLSVTRIPIGQGIAVTPFQMVRAYCALANGGLLPSLRLLDRVLITEEPDVRAGKAAQQHVRILPREPSVQLYKNPQQTHAQMIEMLKSVCLPGGTAKRGAIAGYHTAGKTGTAQKIENGQYSQRKYIGSFIGFAPADDPRFVMLVAVDEPRGVYYGGVVAAPYFSSAGERILNYMNVKPDYELYSGNDPDERRRGKRNPNTKTVLKVGEQPFFAARDIIQDQELGDPDAIWANTDAREKESLPKLIKEIPVFDKDDLYFMKESADAFRSLQQE